MLSALWMLSDTVSGYCGSVMKSVVRILNARWIVLNVCCHSGGGGGSEWKGNCGSTGVGAESGGCGQAASWGTCDGCGAGSILLPSGAGVPFRSDSPHEPFLIVASDVAKLSFRFDLLSLLALFSRFFLVTMYTLVLLLYHDHHHSFYLFRPIIPRTIQSSSFFCNVI